MMELSAVARIHRVTRGKSRMASYSKTIPVCCGSSFTIGGHFDVSSASRRSGILCEAARRMPSVTCMVWALSGPVAPPLLRKWQDFFRVRRNRDGRRQAVRRQRFYALADLPVRPRGVLRSSLPQRDYCLVTTSPRGSRWGRKAQPHAPDFLGVR
jgi:hypothetical protein